MPLTAVQKMQLHNQIERVLHVPGNYRGGILEMALVIDCTYEKEAVRSLCADIMTSCKNQSEIFRNVRLNMVLWSADGIRSEVMAAACVQMGACFDDYEPVEESGSMRTEEILEYLRKFHARSKLILLLTPDGERVCQASQPERARAALQPFLKQKLVLVCPEAIESGTSFFISNFL